jgi:hypothetical protein
MDFHVPAKMPGALSAILTGLNRNTAFSFPDFSERQTGIFDGNS